MEKTLASMFSEHSSRVTEITRPGTAGKRGKTEAGTGKKDAARKAGQVAKSVGTAKAKREALLAKKRGISASAKPDPAQVEAKVQRTKTKVRCDVSKGVPLICLASAVYFSIFY